MKTWRGWVLQQNRSAKNKAMIYGYPIHGGEEIRVQASDRDTAARVIADNLHLLCVRLYFAAGDRRPVAGKTYLVVH